MLREQYSRYLKVTTLVIAALALSSTYNACSDVEFASVEKSSLAQPEDPNTGGLDVIPNTRAVSSSREIPFKEKMVDILIVFDNSGSMRVDNMELGRRLDGFVSDLDANYIDWQMCHTTTDRYQDKGRIRTWDGTNLKVLKRNTPNRAKIFTDTPAVLPEGSGTEEGLTAMHLAIAAPENTDCFREDASLAVIVISDEDQKSCGATCPNKLTEVYDDPASFVLAVANKWAEKVLTVHSIVIKDNVCLDDQEYNGGNGMMPAYIGELYLDLSELTGGVKGDICAASYAPQLQVISERIDEALSSIQLECEPVGQPDVTVTPEVTGLSVTVNGDKLVFEPGLPGGTIVDIDYKCHYN